MGDGGIDSIQTTLDRNCWEFIVNTVMNLRFQKRREVLDICATTIITRRTLLRGVGLVKVVMLVMLYCYISASCYTV
jgi:hypothetical protein